MDFELAWTPEQQAFREEARAWIETHAPRLPDHADPANLTREEYELQRAFGRKLGAKGWLYPTMPAEYGGGGLSMEMAMALEEELDRFNMPLPPYYDTGGKLGAAAILVWGTEEHRRACGLPRAIQRMSRIFKIFKIFTINRN